MFSWTEKVISTLVCEVKLAFSPPHGNIAPMMALSGVKILYGESWWEQQFRAVSHPLLCGLHLHQKKEMRRALSDLQVCGFHAIYLRAFSLNPTAQSWWTIAMPSFKEWADWKVTLFCFPARQFLERQIEGHSSTNLTSIQPELDSCRLCSSF